MAESHRREATQALEQPTLSGLAEVANLSKTVRGLNLSVDPDPGAKREQVIAAKAQVEGLEAMGDAQRWQLQAEGRIRVAFGLVLVELLRYTLGRRFGEARPLRTVDHG